MTPTQNSTPENPRRRRWFTFSLRSLFIAITVLACWLGWQLSVIRARTSLREELKAKRTFSFVMADEYAERYKKLGRPAPPEGKIPRLRRWLGDEGVAEVWAIPHYAAFEEADVERVQAAFPEATIHEALAEPCHPGCFPHGTLVELPGGTLPIEKISIGQTLVAIDRDGHVVTASVSSVFTTFNRLWQIETDAGTLITTETQPFCCSPGRETVAAGQLAPGTEILCREAGRLRVAKVLTVKRTDRVEKVFNLVLGNSEFFVAGGFLARSKPPADNADEIAGEPLRQVLSVE